MGMVFLLRFVGWICSEDGQIAVNACQVSSVKVCWKQYHIPCSLLLLLLVRSDSFSWRVWCRQASGVETRCECKRKYSVVTSYFNFFSTRCRYVKRYNKVGAQRKILVWNKNSFTSQKQCRYSKWIFVEVSQNFIKQPQLHNVHLVNDIKSSKWSVTTRLTSNTPKFIGSKIIILIIPETGYSKIDKK